MAREMTDDAVRETVVALRAEGLRITDVHVHPLDVMGHVLPEDSVAAAAGAPADVAGVGRVPSLSQRLGFGLLSDALMRAVFRFAPGAAHREIAHVFAGASRERVLREMDDAGLDRAVLLPIEPWTPWAGVADAYTGDRLAVLGSVDVHRTPEAEIPALVARFRERGARGIKLHPNLQGFRPLPKENPPAIAGRLRALYAAAREHRLYLHFHGGRSFFAARADARYPETPRLRDAALLSAFADADGRSPLFETFGVPVILAHLGHFGVHPFDGVLLRKIAERHPNVSFDTSAASAQRIRAALEAVGPERLLLGSDGLYNSLFHSLAAVVRAADGDRDMLRDVLGGNYERLVGEGSPFLP